ncbi:MAG: response regulator [Bacteroidota bacterium]
MVLCFGAAEQAVGQDAANHGLRLDGVDDYVDLTPLADEIDWVSRTLTFETWIKVLPLPPEAPVEGTPNGVLLGINGLEQDPASNVEFIEYFYATGQLGISGPFGAKMSEVPVMPDTWYHLAVVWTAEQRRLYVNGELAGLVPQPFENMDVRYSLQLGMDLDPVKPGQTWYHVSDFIAAELDEVRFWRSARSQAEIQTYMWQASPADHPDLLAYLTFDAPESTDGVTDVAGGTTFQAPGQPQRVPVVLPWDQAPRLPDLKELQGLENAPGVEMQDISFLCPDASRPLAPSGPLTLATTDSLQQACLWIGSDLQPLFQRDLPFWHRASSRLARSWHVNVPTVSQASSIQLVVDTSLADLIGPVEQLRLLIQPRETETPQIVKQRGAVVVPERTAQGMVFNLDVAEVEAAYEGARQAAYTIGRAKHWTQQWWMYALYAVLLIGVGTRWRARRSAQRAQALEAEVQQRTAEIEQQRAMLAQQTEQLAALSEARITQFTNLTHELRTPLTLIAGPLAELAKADDVPGRHQPALQYMQRNTTQLQRLISQLMDLARFDAGIVEMKLRPHRIDTLVRGMVEAFAPMAERAGVALHADVTGALWAACDAEATGKIMRNLLSNALKFTPEGGTVRLQARASGGDGMPSVAIRVIDTGVGIPEQSVTQVFDRFYQVNPTATRLQEGSGIGLALAKMLAEAQAGALSIEATAETGTTFRLWLPAAAPAPSQTEAEPVPSASVKPSAGDGAGGAATGPWPLLDDDEAAQDKPLVLVVDDNADVGQFISSLLHPAYRVRHASDGIEALNLAKALLPDAVLSDVMMPRMDGLTLTQALKADPATADIPVLLVTARAGTQDEVDGLKAGAQDYIAKPFDPDVLRARLAAMLAVRDVVRDRLQASPPTPPEVSAANPWQDAVFDVIEARFTDAAFNAAGLAEALGLSRSQLGRRLREQGLPPPGELIRVYRLRKAAHMLRSEALTVSEVAYAVGFNSLSYFSRAFTAHVEMAPSAYRTAGVSGKAPQKIGGPVAETDET